jgi:hypothetical protein
MAQEGVERSVDLKESSTLAFGGGPDETPYKTETLVFGVGKMLDETPSRAETVVITNV